MSKLVEKQKKQTRAELEREQRKKAAGKLRTLRGQIKEAKTRRRVRLKEVTGTCRDARRVISARAKRARARLNASIARTRDRARTVCEVARGDARQETLAEIDRALQALEAERSEQRQLRAWSADPKKKGNRSTSARAAKERAQESDDEVRNNIEDPGMLIVWKKMKHKIRPRGRTPRTEAFFEWAAEHPAQVYEIQEADAVRHLEELERKERVLAGALKRARYVEPPGLEAVPF
jgi:hypothetical protein